MTGKITALALAGVLILGGVCQAQEFEGDPGTGDCGPGGCGHGHGHWRRNQDGRTCVQRVWGWWTYRPLPVPHHLKGCIRFQQTPQAPFYSYFVYLYGPRSPALGFKPTPVHRGEVCAHGLPPAMGHDGAPIDGVPEGYSGDMTSPAEETLPTPRPHNGAIPDQGALPQEAPEESEATPTSSPSSVPVREVSGNRGR